MPLIPFQFTKERVSNGVWILQRNKIVGTCYEVVERIFEHRIRQQTDIGDMQFGFMKGKGTTDAIFIVRQMQEKFRAKGKSSILALWIWKKILIGL